MVRGKAIRAASVALAACVFLTLGCSPETGTAPPDSGSRPPRDVLLVTVDTLRHDATGFSGFGKVETPVTDRLAAGGLVFDFAHAHAVVTLPSHVSILTGLYPDRHGVHDNSGFVLGEEFPTIATLLRRRGYRTAAFVSAFTVDRRFGLARGFDVYDDRYDGHGRAVFVPPERPGSRTVELAAEWWERNRGARRFLWVHLFTPHFPYTPAEPYASRHPADPYYGEAAQVDGELRPLLERVLDGADAETIVVYTSDHGESLGEHGESTHGIFAYESTLRVPLVVRAAGMVEPGVSHVPARHVDIVPTVLDLLGVDAPAGLSGRSLVRPGVVGAEAGSYFEALSAYLNRGWAPLRGRIEGYVKAIDLPVPELYDLERDPGETDNLAQSDPGATEDILSRIDDSSDPAGHRSELSSDTIRRLRSLGYAASEDTPRPEQFGPSSDPKSLVEFGRMIDDGLALFTGGRVTEAIATFEELIERQPGFSLAYSHLAYIYADTGRIDDAILVLQAAVARGVGTEAIHRSLALNLVAAGRVDEAWRVLESYASSENPETQSALGRIAAVQGRGLEARRRFERALAIDPTYPTAHMDLGILLMTEGRLPEATPHLERAVEEDPYLAEAWNGLGVVRLQAGDPSGAVAAWRKAVEADPHLADALFNLGVTLGRVGDPVGAAEALRRYLPLVHGRARDQALELVRQLEAQGGRRP